jgi:hypothetical protein
VIGTTQEISGSNCEYQSLCLYALAIATSVSLNAAVLTVISPADSGPGSLRDLVAASSSGDTIQFAISGTILLNSAITIPHTLFVLGPGPSSLTINAQHFDRAFITTGNPVLIAGMTITNGFAAGFNGPDATSPGQPGGPGTDGQGGAILGSISLSISNCWLTGNTAQGGRGGNGGGNPAGAGFTTGNGGDAGQGLGGAVYADGSVTGSVVVVNCTFSGNRAIGGIGGAGGTNANPAVHETGGTGGVGGNAEGGAVYEENAASFSFTNDTFSGNSATGGDGGVGGDSLNGPGGNGGDAAGALGGAINTFQPLFLSCTIVSNSVIGGTAGAGGNGFPPGNSGTTGLTSGGGVYGYAINCLSPIGNTIIANNFSSGTQSNFFIAFNDKGYNLFGTDDPTFCGGPPGGPGTQYGTDASPLDPQLGPLAQNGGGMPTHAVPPGSRVLDQGYSFGLTNDERGAVRPYVFPLVSEPAGGDGSDIGAFELGSPDLGASVLSNVVVISWPAAYGDFVLQSATNLQGPGAWTAVPTPPLVVSNQFVVTNQVTNGSMFFRLLNQLATQ